VAAAAGVPAGAAHGVGLHSAVHRMVSQRQTSVNCCKLYSAQLLKKPKVLAWISQCCETLPSDSGLRRGFGGWLSRQLLVAAAAGGTAGAVDCLGLHSAVHRLVGV
jgi:hypothetical protein